MKLNFRNAVLAAILASGTTLASMPAANAACGLECWLSNTFSTNDFVGEWLQDTFGPVNNGGAEGGEPLAKALKMSDKVASRWKPGQTILDQETIANSKPACKLPALLSVVNKTKSPDAVLKRCF